jgi:hypothetical protein
VNACRITSFQALFLSITESKAALKKFGLMRLEEMNWLLDRNDHYPNNSHSIVTRMGALRRKMKRKRKLELLAYSLIFLA